MSVINHYYGRDDIRLGAFKGDFGDYIGGNYIDDLVDNFDSPVKHYDQVEDAVSVLRQTLAEAEVRVIQDSPLMFFKLSNKDHSVVIASVGFLLNIADLLRSSGDGFSEKSGYDLVRDKVISTMIS